MLLQLPTELRDKVLDLTDRDSRAQLRLVSHAVKLAVDGRTECLSWKGGKMLVKNVQCVARCTRTLSLTVRGGDGTPRGGPKNKISTAVLGALAAVRFSQLRWLDLSGNRARSGSLDAGMQHFARGNWPLLAVLDLGACGLTGKGAAHLGGAAWPRLREIDLRDNALGPDGVAWVAAFPRLHTLILSGCGIGDGGIAALVATGARCIKRLDLTRNEITKAGLIVMARATWSLTHLQLDTNFLGEAAAADLAAATAGVDTLSVDYAHVGTFARLAAGVAGVRRLSARNSMRFDPDVPTDATRVAAFTGALEFLDLSFNSGLVMREALVSRDWPRLTGLVLRNLDDETMMELFLGDTCFPALETLDLKCRAADELMLGTWMVLLEDSARRFPKLRLCVGTSRYPQIRTQLVPRFNASRPTLTEFRWGDL